MQEALGVILLFGLSLGFILLSVLFLFYSERKLSAFIQDRHGPLHVGKSGLLQPAADLIKLIQKETIVPANSIKFLFLLAPFLVFASIFCGFALIPLWPALFKISYPPGGILLLLGLISIEAIAIFMAGYASQSKFPLLGAGRAVGQMISYELAMGFSIIALIMTTGSLSLRDIVTAQSGWHWNVLYQPLGCLLFII